MTMNKKRANLHRLPQNLCTKFLLPSLEISSRGITNRILDSLGFINAYLEDKNHKIDTTNTLTLVFSYASSLEENFEIFLSNLKKDVPNFIGSYQIDYCTYGLMFKIKEKWQLLPDLFKQGKYKEFGNTYAQFFKKTADAGIIYEYGYNVITHSKDYQYILENNLGLELGELDEAELASIPEEKDYIFDYEQIIKEQENYAVRQ